MATTVRKGLLGKEDVKFWTAASPTFSRYSSTGGVTTPHAISATHIPIDTTAGTNVWTSPTVHRALYDLYYGYQTGISNFPVEHLNAGLGSATAGQHKMVFGFRNGAAATNIQAAASNQYLINKNTSGFGCVELPPGVFTLSTAMQLPRKCVLVGSGKGTLIRGNATVNLSRLITISGSVAATVMALGGKAFPGDSYVDVTNGALWGGNFWCQIVNNTYSDMHEVVGVTGNTLRLDSPVTAAYGATAMVRMIYPAEIYMDRIRFETESIATMGYSVMATRMVRSYFGPNIYDKSRRGFYIKNSAENNFQFTKITNNYGFNLGVPITLDQSHSNIIGGQRGGVSCALASRNSINNRFIGVGQSDISYAAGAGDMLSTQGVSDPIRTFYRNNKPQMAFARYTVAGGVGATWMVSVPATSTSPAEVCIDGRVYRNTGTILCDLSREKTPANATVCGLERGPSATATRTYYIYAVPSGLPSATRQFDVIASAGIPSVGPAAAGATYPQWSYLGPVNTLSPVALAPFRQTGDMFENEKSYNLVSYSSPVSYQATYKYVTGAIIPSGSKSVIVSEEISYNLASCAGAWQLKVQDGDLLNLPTLVAATAQYAGIVESGSFAQPTSQRRSMKTVSNVKLSSPLYFGYIFNGPNLAQATVDLLIRFMGSVTPRANYK